MTASDTQMETWKPVPGAGYYEVSHRGHVRSVDRTINGRFCKGVVLKPRQDGDGYLVVNITYDGGERRHGVSVARLVLLAHDGEPPGPSMQACHGPGGQRDNRWPENLRWDTDEANRQEALVVRLQNRPPKPPRPLKACPRCGAQHGGKGQNCHECVVGLGVRAALLLSGGMMLDKVAAELEYPPAGAFTLAVKYGGLRVTLDTGHRPSPQPWLRRVMNARKASRQNSDAQ
jgi:NUMOD4 motif